VTQLIRVELLKLITELNPTKLYGLDNIHLEIIRDVASIVSEPLIYIYSLSLNSGIVPDALKVAKVIPVYKKGEANLTTNCSPISLLRVFNKILERMMYNRLHSYFNKQNILYKRQFGFRKKTFNSNGLS
jgi:hypothetical protein